MTEFKYIVTPEDVEKGLRCNQLLRRNFRFSSRLRAKIKQNKTAFLNGKPITGKMVPAAGDELLVLLPEETSHFIPESIPIDPLYEDDHLLIINKQAGIIVHPTRNRPRHTIANGVARYMEETGENFKIRFVNRLDMDTSGVLVLAKNSLIQNDYMEQQKAGKVERKYTAIVKGVPAPLGTIDIIDAPIGRPDPAKPERAVIPQGRHAVTHYQVQKIYTRGLSSYSLVHIRLETGRTHQIRVHMSHIGCPVVGDALYSGEAVHLIERQALHATSLTFSHPITKKRLYVEAPLPDDMQGLLETLSI